MTARKRRTPMTLAMMTNILLLRSLVGTVEFQLGVYGGGGCMRI